MSWREFVERRGCYFHQVDKPNYPKAPVGWFGFRYRGRLLSMHRVDEVVGLDCRSHLARHEAFRLAFDGRRVVPHYVYWLGPAVVPEHEIRSGNVFGPGHLCIDRDLLLSSGTVEEAFIQTKQRQMAAG